MKIRIATKQIEKRIVKIAKIFEKSPYKALPECQGNCKSCYFEKMKKELDKFSNKEFIKKMANKKGFVAALANIVLLADQKIPYVAYTKINERNLYYAKRGKVKDELLIGLQNWDMADIRLLAYMEIAKKKKVNLFSLPDRLICSNVVPKDFLNFIEKKFSCNENEYIKIKWREKEIKCCSDKNSLIEMKKYFYYPRFEEEIEVEVNANIVECKNKCMECLIKDALNKKLDISNYIEGKMGDKSYIENYKKKIMWNIEKKKVFIIGKNCYGDNIEKFLGVLNPKEWEKEAIIEILEKEKKAVIIQQASAPKLLEKYGIDSQKLKEKYMRKKEEEILKKLPKIEGNEIMEFIDELAKIYKVGGKEALLKEIKQRKMDVKEKAISYAFLKALNMKGEEWKYTKMEIEFGEHLSKLVMKLLKAEGEEYKNAIENLAKEVG